MTDTPLAAVLAEWLAGLRLADIPDEVLADVRLRVLDTLGVALAAVPSAIGKSVRAAALRLGDGREARLLGTGERVPATSAALVNGTLAHALDFDDTHNATIIHASSPIVATALAVCEARGLGGADFALAVAAGNEIVCRIGLAAPGAFHRQGLHPTGVVGAVGAAMVAARHLGLGADGIARAAGIAGSQAAGILESFSDGSFVKTLHPGWAAHAGIVAARLAEAGFTGPATVLEGRFGLFRSHLPSDSVFDFAAVARELGGRWDSLDASFKPYPCAHVIHPFVDAVLALAREHRLGAGDIAAVEATVAPYAIPVVCEPRAAKLRPATPTHARASLPYALAAAVVRNGLGVEAYADDAIAEPETLALAERVMTTVDPAPPPRGVFRGTVAIETRDGRRLARVEAANRGSRANPLAPGEIEEKFRACAAAVLPPERREAIVGSVRRLQDLASAGELVDLCIA